MSITTMRRKFGHHMRTVLWVILAVFVIGIPAMYMGSSYGPRPTEEATQVMAVVNGREVTRLDLDLAYKQTSQMWEQFGGVTIRMLEYTRGSALQQAIEQAMLLADAEARGLKVSGREVGDYINTAIDQEVKRQKATGDLASQLRAEMRTTLDAQRPFIEKGLLMRKLQDQVGASVRVTEADLMKSFEQIHARHILVATKPPKGPARTDEQALAKAQELLAKIKGGADFAAVAKASSDDPGSAAKGGDLGFFGMGMMDPGFETAAFNLKAGEMTAVPVKSAYGYHLIQVLAVKSNVPKDLEKNKKQLLESLRQQRQQQAWGRYVQDLRSKAKIEIKDVELQAADALFRGDQENAMKLFAAAVAQKEGLEPQARAACYYELGNHYAASGKWQEAADNLNQALDFATTDQGDIYLALGRAYAGLKDKAKAVEYFGLAAKDRPDDYMTHANLQQEYTKLGETALAAAEKKWMADFAAKQKAEAAAAAQLEQVTPARAGTKPAGKASNSQ